MKTEKEKRRKITVQTVPNGYSVEIAGKGYQYFNEESLIAGLFFHLVDKSREDTDTDMMKNIFEAAATWPTVKDAIKANAKLMTEREEAVKLRSKKVLENRDLRDQIERREKKIDMLKLQLKECHDKIANLMLIVKCKTNKQIKCYGRN